MPFSEDVPIRRRSQLVWPSEPVSSPSRGPYSRSISGPYSGGFGAFAPVDGATGAAIPAKGGGFSGIFDDLKLTFSSTWGKLALLAVGAGMLFWGERAGWFDSFGSDE